MPSPLLPSTLRRLQKQPQNAAIWEFVRRPAPANLQFQGRDGQNQDLILIGDATDHILRGFESVDRESGHEAIVRALIKAMERPELPLRAGRPVKIICPSRDLQIYLRGILQGLTITIDYSPHMTIVEDFFQELAHALPPPDRVPSSWENALGKLIHDLWEEAPWENLTETQVVRIGLGRFGVEDLWACALGSLYLDPAVMFFRSRESIKTFLAVSQTMPDHTLEQFHELDGLGVVFPDGFAAKAQDPPQGIVASIHPLEGFRDYLDDEESQILWIAATAYLKFLSSFSRQLRGHRTPHRSLSLAMHSPEARWGGEITVRIETEPSLTATLDALRDKHQIAPKIAEVQSDCINLAVKESNLLMGSVPRQFVDVLETLVSAPINIPCQGNGIPFVAIRTVESEAKTIARGIERYRGPFNVAIVDGLDHSQVHVANLLVAVAGTNPPLVLWQGPSGLPDASSLATWSKELDHSQGQCILLVTKGDPQRSQSTINPRDVIAWRMAFFRESTAFGINLTRHGAVESELL